MEENKNLFILGKPRSLLQIILASFFYSITIFFIWIAMNRMVYPERCTRDEYKGSVILLELTSITLLIAIFLSARISLFIDFKKQKIFEHYNLGICRFKLLFLKDFSNIDYISIFLPNDNKFYIMVWLKDKNKLSLCSFNDFEPALNFGKLISSKLNIDLLDATEKGNFKWIDKTEL